jgi:hypothetical protein
MKKIIALILMALVATTFTACGNNDVEINKGEKITYFNNDYVPPYNAVLYDSAVELINEDFKNENSIRVVGFIDDAPETRLPATRTFIVADSEHYEEIFVKEVEECKVDFDSEMLIVYTFGTEYILPAYILDMNLSGNELAIDYTIPQYLEAGSAGTPFQRWFVIKLNKLEITTAVFENKLTYYKNHTF